MKKALIITALLATGQMASAADNYFTLSYGALDLEDVNPSALIAGYGGEFSNSWNWEVRAGLGIADDSGIELDNLLGAYAIYHFNRAENFRPYVVLGYSRAELGSDFGSTSDNGLSYGIGSDVRIGGSLLNLEYINYVDVSGVDLSSFSVGMKWEF